MITTKILLPQTVHTGPTPQVVTGTSQPGASYYLGHKTMQTAHIKYTGATATITIEATLVQNPAESDWFTAYTLSTGSAATASTFANIEGNFMLLRAKVTDFTAGIIDFIKVSY